MSKRWEDEFKARLEDTNKKLHDDWMPEWVENTGELIDKIIKTLYAIMEKPVPVNKLTPKLDNSFKPSVLANSSNLNEFNAWEKDLLTQMDTNSAFLAVKGNQKSFPYYTPWCKNSSHSRCWQIHVFEYHSYQSWQWWRPHFVFPNLKIYSKFVKNSFFLWRIMTNYH